MNSVNEIGRICTDVTINTTQSGIEYLPFTIAVDCFVSKGQDKQTLFLRCKAWKQKASFIGTYFKKGDLIAITGSLKPNDYTDKDGKKHNDIYVDVSDASFCGGKKADNGESPTYNAPSYSAPAAANFESLASDDDLPF